MVLGAGLITGTLNLKLFSRMQFGSTSYYHTIVPSFHLIFSSSPFLLFTSSSFHLFSLHFLLFTFFLPYSTTHLTQLLNFFKLPVRSGHGFGNQYNKVCCTNIFLFYFIDFFLKLCCNSNYL